MRPRPALSAEPLEDRENPVTFGVPWPDGQHLTLSLAPDNTPIEGTGSALATLLNRLGPQAELDVLRAWQNWADVADINIGLVGDTGAAFGTGGPVQGDPRFGDIRVGGRPLSPDVLAVTAPYAPFNNYSGDVVVNTAAGFTPGGANGGYDLYTALMQESGHSLGVGNSTDPASVMYEYYSGARTGLSAGDIASIQALYGPRVPDRYEGPRGDDTPATAAWYTGPVDAELSTPTDVDVYKFAAGLLTNSVTVNLTAAGLSLVTAKVDLLDANGNVVATAQTTDPTANNVTLSLGSVRPFGTYYVRVSAADPTFGVGAYHLEVRQSSLLTQIGGLVNNLLTETGLNNTLATATALLTRGGTTGPQAGFNASAGFGSASDVDYYRFTVPATGSSAPVTLLTTVWGKNGAVLNPWVDIEDAFGNSLAGEVLTADGNTTTIQVRGLLPGRTYFLKLTSDTHSVGAYELSGDLGVVPITFPIGDSDTVSPASPAASVLLSLSQTDQVHVVLSATGAAGQSAVLLVAAADGTVMAQLIVPTGRGRSVDLFLPAGQYLLTVRLAAGTAPVGFVLGAAVVTDPVGATPEDPSSTPDGSSSTTTTTSTTPGGPTGTTAGGPTDGSTDPSDGSSGTPAAPPADQPVAVTAVAAAPPPDPNSDPSQPS